MPTIKDVRNANKRDHWAARQQQQLEARGPKGLAEAWWDRAKAQCKRREEADPEVWDRLARTLQNFIEHDAA